MNLQPNDLHFVFNDTLNRLVVYNAQHAEVWRTEMRNSTVNDGTFGHYGNCPRGVFKLGVPIPKHEPAFGYWFTPVLDYQGHFTMRDFGREGIGVHGGGTGLANPFAPAQGWQVTHGCLRLQNANNAYFVKLVQQAQKAGGVCYLTVAGDANGS